MKNALVIGGGPAGLMAADVLSDAGCSVIICDAMPTVGRKFLMAGKSGLNLTKDESIHDFMTSFGDRSGLLDKIISSFGPEEVCHFAKSLDQEVFKGSTGRVFPNGMKASPFLRAWLARLNSRGVTINTRWKWTGWDGAAACFDTPDGPRKLEAEATILALGGASWARLGSDGRWAGHLADAVTPFQPANVGFEINWSSHMEPHFGVAVKGCALRAGDMSSRGEFIVSQRGIEGGGIYEISAAVRDGAPLVLDLLPDMSRSEVEAMLTKPRGKQSQSNWLRKVLKLDPVKRGLLNEFGRGMNASLAEKIKALMLPPLTPRPIDEAISTAGGVRFEALDENLMLRSRAGVYCTGEMLDWEAPTGGYLITGCLATGRWAGLAASRRLQTS